MRVFLISLFFIISATNFSVAACSTEIPADGCEAGCYANAGTCTACPNGQYSPKGSKQQSDCHACNIPSGATSFGPGTSNNSCPWTITCQAGTAWNEESQQCQACGEGTESDGSTIIWNGSTYTPGFGPKQCTPIEYKIKYDGENAPSEPQTCTFFTDCEISDPTGTKDCHVFNGWKCTSGCNEQITVKPGDKFNDTKISQDKTEITLTAQWSVCPNGYYCTNGTATACPHPGTTTSNSATACAKAETACYISNATQFRDKHNSIFTLPIGNINYIP